VPGVCSRRLIALTAVLLSAAGCGAVDRPAATAGRFDATVARVVDGDTVTLAPGGRARLIGVDTPEVFGRSECFGREASAFAKRRLAGRRVTVEVGTEPRDRYGRLLVYLYAGGRLFNDELVREGYATVLTIAPNVERARELRAASHVAREQQRGLWGACPLWHVAVG
jgi:micrococcal nuclease